MAAFDLPTLVVSPRECFLKDRFLARVMCATGKLSQLLELELQLLVSASASPWACVIQISCCWKSDW